MWRRAVIALLGLTLLMPTALAETELEFVDGIEDLLDDSAYISQSALDAANDYADGWITESQFYDEISTYRDDMHRIENKIFAKEAPCQAYNNYLYNIQWGINHSAWALDDLFSWVGMENSDDYESALDHMRTAADYFETAKEILNQISIPACNTSNGGADIEGGDDDIWIYLAAIGGIGGVGLFVLGISSYYKGGQKKRLERELRAKGICPNCRGEGFLRSAKEGPRTCQSCGGSGRAEEAIELTEEEKVKFDKYLESKQRGIK